MSLRVAPLLAACCLTGCTLQGDFPSVAPRPEEGAYSIEEPVRPPLVVASDAALLRQVAALRQQATEGDRAFDSAYGPAETAIGRAGAPQSESWVEAQLALSRLEAARAETAAAQTGLDRLALDRANLPTSEDDVAAINEAIAFAEAIAGRQQQRLEALRGRLGTP